MSDEKLEQLQAEARRRAEGIVESGNRLADMLRRSIEEDEAAERRAEFWQNLIVGALIGGVIVLLVFA